ncbi:MAG: glycosyl transferase [Betaproteobacteria bacterium]|nr:glycosyl transferase [Betaproteobacteria bacterium]
MNSARPLISVILPLERRTQHAVDAVRSIVQQTYRPLELIVVDCADDRDTVAQIQNMLGNPPADIAVTIISKQNFRAAPAINEGLRAARGDYIALLTEDDAYAPNRLQSCLAAAPGAGIVITHLTPIDTEGHPLTIGNRWRTDYELTLLKHIGAFPSLSCLSVFHDIVVTPGNLFFSRDLLSTVGDFADYPQLHYLDFFLRAALVEEPFLIREKLLVHRVAAGRNTDQAPRADDEHTAVLRKHLVTLMNSERPANRLADVFDAHPFLFAQTGWPEALKNAFDGLLEYRNLPLGETADAVDEERAPQQKSGRDVTLVTHELSLTGAPVIVLELASLLRARGHPVTVLSLLDGPLKPEFIKRAIEVKVPPLVLDRLIRLQAWTRHWAERGKKLPERLLHRLTSATRELAEWLWKTRLRPQASGILVLNSVASCELAARLPANWKGDAFWYVHESLDLPWIMPKARENAKVQRLVADGRLKIIFGSEATRQHWAASGYDGEVRYWSGINNLADESADAWRRDERSKREKRVVLNVGSVSGRKGSRTLVEAFALGRAERLIPDDVDLCIVGCALPSLSAEARDLVRRIHQPDICGHVRLVASVEPRALRAYYAEADVYAHASIFDCMPIALLSAMAHALPIVATDVDGCREAILHESCGLLVQPGQVRAMAEALGTLLTQHDKARSFGAAARARFVDRFSLETTFEPLYQTLIGAAPSA